MAFFPCIYFCAASQIQMSFGERNYKNLSVMEKAKVILQRVNNREEYFRLAVMLFAIVEDRGLRMIMENPWSEQTYLKANFVRTPSLIDNDRTLRGDHFRKPTAYWFVGCERTFGETLQKRKNTRRINSLPPGKQAGLCSEERSMISPDYARNFICDFILGKPQKFTQLSLFD